MSCEWKWQFALDHISKTLTPYGFTVERSFSDYEIAKVTGHGVSLVVYPHTVSSTRNQHVRIKNNGSKDRQLAVQAIFAIQDAHHGRDHNYYCKQLPKHRFVPNILADVLKSRAEGQNQ